MNTYNTSNNKVTQNKDTITLGGGCFWCIEAIYRELNGVESVVSGYSGGNTKNPTYNDVCTGTTNHAEVVQITFDTSVVSLEEILEVFFTVHDPTTINRQGHDIGTQYRSVIFCRNNDQEMRCKNIINELNKIGAYSSVIVTQVVPFEIFYPAENYHQDYFNNNTEQPYCQMVIQPKIEKFRKIFDSKRIEK